MIIKLLDILSDEEKCQLTDVIENYCVDDNSPGWKLNGSSNSDNEDKLFWYLNVENNKFFNEVLFCKIKEIIKEYLDEEIVYTRIYLNGHTFGQQGYFHTDDDDLEGRTLLIYCNNSWKVEYCGATVFDKGNEIISMYPEPFSAVYFNANIKHFSQPISRDFLGLRITLAYKLKVI